MDDVCQYGINLSLYFEKIPSLGKSEPMLNNWKSLPPYGGWVVPVMIEGVSEVFLAEPQQIVELISQRLADVPNEKIWDYCNMIWRHRHPSRFDSTATETMALDDLVKCSLLPSEIFQTDLSRIQTELQIKPFNQTNWESIISKLCSYFDPANKKEYCSAAIHEKLTKLNMRINPYTAKDEESASLWLSEAARIFVDSAGQARLNVWNSAAKFV